MVRKLTGKELEKAVANSFDIGEDMAIMHSEGKSFELLNKRTGMMRQIVNAEGELSVPDEDIDFDAIEKGCPHYQRPSRSLNYGGLSRWSNFKHGVCALSWTLYPDGRYFADDDGYGMEDNKEETAYCIIDTSLRIIVPFQPIKNIVKTLEQY